MSLGGAERLLSAIGKGACGALLTGRFLAISLGIRGRSSSKSKAELSKSNSCTDKGWAPKAEKKSSGHESGGGAEGGVAQKPKTMLQSLGGFARRSGFCAVTAAQVRMLYVGRRHNVASFTRTWPSVA
tara:strand:- start:670 stop:1053 length:384 start_codon:yes stop_codon:yes gene_type:complete